MKMEFSALDYEHTASSKVIERKKWKMIGYIPKEDAQIIAPEMDSGIFLSGKVVKIDKSRAVPFIKIRISISNN